MLLFQHVKRFLYRLASRGPGRLLLALLSCFVAIPSLASKDAVRRGKRDKRPKKPFHVILTVDTEGGHVDGDERRRWQGDNPWAYGGFIMGVGNIRSVCRRYGIRATYFLSTHCFSSEGSEYEGVVTQLRGIWNEGDEIGLHPHPDSDLALRRKLAKILPATSCFHYSEEQIREILRGKRELIHEHLGAEAAEAATSIRWGGWGLNSEGVRAIRDSRFLVDSSAAPGKRGHLKTAKKHDWSRVRRQYPWKMNPLDYQDTEGGSALTQMPIATFSCCGVPLLADPLYTSALLKKAFLGYYRKADRDTRPFPFVIMTHSTEATTADGRPTRVVEDLEDFIRFARRFPDVEFLTMKEARARYEEG